MLAFLLKAVASDWSSDLSLSTSSQREERSLGLVRGPKKADSVEDPISNLQASTLRSCKAIRTILVLVRALPIYSLATFRLLTSLDDYLPRYPELFYESWAYCLAAFS
jgi:hypothetical protein